MYNQTGGDRPKGGVEEISEQGLCNDKRAVYIHTSPPIIPTVSHSSSSDLAFEEVVEADTLQRVPEFDLLP